MVVDTLFGDGSTVATHTTDRLSIEVVTNSSVTILGDNSSQLDSIETAIDVPDLSTIFANQLI